ncbi:MAG: biotin transporter BioY [Spirochaetales bacterium]|nr:biotin transporter BioY [Spirochaetales bacterium]
MSDRNALKRNLAIALFAALMAAGAFIRIPIGPVPISLTTLFLLLSALLLGPAAGSLSVLVYLIIGMSGLPVFAGGSGPAVFAGPTGGFLIGYIPAALVCGFISHDSSAIGRLRFPFRDVMAVAAGSLLLYAFGVPWLKWRLGLEWNQALSAGMLPFLPGDALKAAAAIAIRLALVKRAPELLPVRGR